MHSIHDRQPEAASPSHPAGDAAGLAASAALIIVGLALAHCTADTGWTDRPVRFITVASTTSTQNSGLFDHILPLFTARTGIEVRVLAVGTGQAIRLAERGDADVLFVHHRSAEERFVAEGYGVERRPVMFNDFVLVGPATDPAHLGETATIEAAFQALAASGSVFISRGDDSGTHRKEQALWEVAGIDVHTSAGRWYREAGAGMGATLNIAADLHGYTLTDRATWVNFVNPGDLQILFEGDPHLVNPYGVTAVNPARYAHTKATDGELLVDWLTSTEGQNAIASYEVHGTQLFFPMATRNNPGD